MFYLEVIIAIFSLPFIWIVWSAIDVKRKKREKIALKGPILLFALITIASIIVNIYLSSQYNLPFFQNSFSTTIGIIVTVIIWVVIAFINIVVTSQAIKYNIPKSRHNPKVVWIFNHTLSGSMLIFFLWFMPLGEKINYVVILNDAMEALEHVHKNEDISVILVRSEDRCFTFSGVNRNGTMRVGDCGDKFNNVFYMRNNLKETKDFQVRIHAFDQQKRKVTVIESDFITLDPGEIHMVTTEETSSLDDIWNSYSFQTEKQIRYFQYEYRYREPE